MRSLGILFKRLGQYQKARGYYEKTIAIFTRHYGPNHAMTKKAKGLLTDLEEVVAKNHQKQPKPALANSPKNDAQNLNDNEVFDLD